MWNRLTSYGQDAGESSESSTGEVAPVPEDVREQLEQQQVLIEQLKSLVRENENQLSAKEKLLEESNVRLQKFKLQSKAKNAQLNKLKEKLPSVEKPEETDESNNGSAQGSPVSSASDQGSRGKALLLKKQLQESKLKFEQREKENHESRKNWESAVEKLQAELNERNKVIESLKSGEKAASQYKQQEEEYTANKDVSELYAQIVYKDKKIMDLNDKILESERRIMDLQENLREKDEVLSARNKAIQLMTEDLSKKGKVAVDNLDETRTEMRQMQELFAEAESRWNQEKIALKEIITNEKEKFTSELNEKENKIKQAEETLKSLEQARFDLAKRNAELQEKVVRVQESFEKWKENHQKTVEAEINDLKANFEKKEAEVKSLKEKLEQATSDVDTKILKARAKERSKLKALQKEMDELKKNGGQPQGNGEEKIAELGKHIAELEEEKGSLLLKVMELEEQCKSEEKWTLERSITEQSVSLSESEIEKLRNEKLELEERIATIMKEKEVASKEIENLSKSNSELQMKLNETEAEFIKYKNSVNQLETKMQSYEERIKMLEANQYALAEEIVEKEKMVQDLQVSLKVVQDDKVALEMRIIEFEEQREVDDKEKDTLDKEIKRLKQKIEDENVPVLAIEKEKEALEKDLAALKIVETQQLSRLNEFQNKISQLISETERLQDNHAIASEEMEKLEEEISYKCSEIDSKNELLQAQSYRLDEMEQALENSEDQIHSLERKLNEKAAEINHLANREVDLENEKAQLEGALNQSQAQISELRETIKKTVESMENLLQQALIQKERELQATLKQKDTDLEASRLENNKLKHELENAVENQSTQGVKIQTKISSLLEQISELESELSSSQIKFNEKSSEYEKLNQDKQLLSEQFENLQITLNDKIQVISSLEDEKLRLINELKNSEDLETKLKLELEDNKNLLFALETNLNKIQEEKGALLNELNARTEELSAADEQLSAKIQELSRIEDQLKLSQEENQKLNDSLKVKIQEVLDICAEKDKIRNELENIKQEIHSKEQDVNIKISQLESELSTSRVEKEDLIVKLRENDLVVNGLKETISHLEKSFHEIQQNLDYSNEEKVELSEKVRILTEEIQSKDAYQYEIQKQLVYLTNQSDFDKQSYEEFINFLSQFISPLITNLQETIVSRNNLASEITSFSQDCEQLIDSSNIHPNTEPSPEVIPIPKLLNENQNQILHQLNEALTQVHNFNQFLSYVDGNVKNFRELTIKLRTDNDKLNSEVNRLEADKHNSVSKLTFDVENLSENCKRLETELHNSQQELESLRNENTVLKTNLEEKERELKLTNDTITSLNEEKESLIAAKQSLENNITTLETALQNCKSEMSMDTAQQHELQLKFQLSEDKNVELESKLCQMEEKRRQLELQNERLAFFETEYQNCCVKIEEMEQLKAKMLQDHEELQKTTAELREKINIMESQLDSLRNEQRLTLETLNRTVDELKNKNHELDQAREREEELCEKIEELNKSYIVLQTEKDLLEKQHQETEQNMKELKETAQNYQQQVQTLSENLQTLQNENLLLKSQADNQSILNESLRKDIEDSILEISSLKNLNDNLEASKNVAEEKVKNLNLELEVIERERDNFQSQMEMYQIQCTELQNGTEESVKNMSLELESSRSKVIELQNQLSELDSYKNQLQDRVTELENSQDILQNETQDLKSRIEQTERTSSGKENFNEKLEKILESKTAEFEVCLNQTTQLQANNVKLESQVASLSEELGRIQHLTENLDRELEETRTESESRQLQLFYHEKKLKELSDQITTLNSELESKNLELEKFSNLTQELETFRENYDRIKNDLHQSNQFNEQLKEELHLLKSKETLENSSASQQLQDAIAEKNYYEKLSSDLKVKLESNLETQIGHSSQLEELSFKINLITMERDSFRAKCEELEADVIQSREEVEIKKEKITLLGSEDQKGASVDLESEVQNLKAELDRNKTKMGKMLFKLKQFKEKNDKLSLQVNELSNASKIESNDDVSSLKTEVESLKLENEKLCKEVEDSKDIKERFNNLEILCQNLNKEILEVSEAKTKEQIAFQREKDTLNEELRVLQQIKQELENQTREIRLDLSAANSEKEQLAIEMAILREQSEMLSNDNETYQTLIENLKQSKRNFETELQKQKEIHSKEIKQLENELQNKLDHLGKMEQELRDKDHAIAKLNEELEAEAESYDKLQAEFSTVSAERRKLETEKRELGYKLEEASSNIERELLLQEMEALKEHYEQRLQEDKLRNSQQLQQAVHVQSVEASRTADAQLLEDKISGLEENVEQLTKHKSSLLEELSEVKRLYEDANLNRNQIQIEADALMEKLKANNQQQRQLLQELNAAKQSVDSQRQIAQNITMENEELRTKMEALERQYTNIYSEKVAFEKLYHDTLNQKQVLEESVRNNVQVSNERRNQQLEVELQQAMQTIHQQGLRCEELSLEISKLIEEKSDIQQQLSQNQRIRKDSKPLEQFVSIEMDNAFEQQQRTHSKSSVVNTSQLLELQQRLEETENAKHDLLSTNASLERDLAREKERRTIVEEELTSVQAWQERMGLSSSKDEYHLLLEEEPQMIPETDFSISRRVLTNAYRVKRWVNGRRNYFSRIVRRSSRIQLVLYFYLFAIHVWLLTCLL